jgi:hypothetical protein
MLRNSQLFNEIMPTICKLTAPCSSQAHLPRQTLHREGSKRVAADLQGTTAEASEACLKECQALQLLEYLVKNGSERVVDDARTHLAMVKILRNFHYIDEKGKDQGINGSWPSLCACYSVETSSNSPQPRQRAG